MKGRTYEETIVEALDALDARRFWAEAEAYSKWRRDLPAAEREALAREEAEIDGAFDGIA